ncbi:MAG: nucleotidyltransferase family protein [Odoribacteraceae bacterium]|jgi:NDP-sugar pyrophosphorylase family protein|nr:nucleotidyltransferase family protein [Odoribacteraceae bacterium]
MNGMIFAAGLGTRLRAFTGDRPKALVEVGGKPLLHHVIERLNTAGVQRLVINVHHFASQIEEFLRARDNFGLDVHLSDERDQLLDTGGGLLKARGLFLPALPVLLHNVDILSDVDLNALVQEHERGGARATLVVQPVATARVLRFDASNLLTGWENRTTGEQKIARPRFQQSAAYSFCGIQVVSPAYLRAIQHRGVFSIIDEHLVQARCHDIRAFLHRGTCLDMGTPEAIAAYPSSPISCRERD